MQFLKNEIFFFKAHNFEYVGLIQSFMSADGLKILNLWGKLISNRLRRATSNLMLYFSREYGFFAQFLLMQFLYAKFKEVNE